MKKGLLKPNALKIQNVHNKVYVLLYTHYCKLITKNPKHYNNIHQKVI